LSHLLLLIKVVGPSPTGPIHHSTHLPSLAVVCGVDLACYFPFSGLSCELSKKRVEIQAGIQIN